MHFNVQKRWATYSARRDEEMKWEHRENKNRCIAYCCITDGSLGKIILDSRLDLDQKEPEDQLISF